jgi:hypothetical protein
MSATPTPEGGVPWIAGILGLAFGSLIGPAFLPLPQNLKSLSPDARRMAILKTGAVCATFGTLGAAIGVALTGEFNCPCPCPPGATGAGTPLIIHMTPPPVAPPSAANIPSRIR